MDKTRLNILIIITFILVVFEMVFVVFFLVQRRQSYLEPDQDAVSAGQTKVDKELYDKIHDTKFTE